MNNIDEIIGKYKASEREENAEFWNNFELEIYKINQQIKFNFEMKTEGSFGIVGKNWYGKGIYRSDHLALIIEQEKDWTFIQEDDDLTEYMRAKNESLPVEIYTDEEKVVVYHKNIDRFILLKKVKENDDSSPKE